LEAKNLIHIVIADDHHLVRQGIRALLDSENDIHVIGEAQDGQEALELVDELKPDVLVLDINMPRLDGIEVVRNIREISVNTQVLILSMYSDESLVKRAFRYGARGYLLKRSVTEELLVAVRKVSCRDIYISPEISQSIDIDWPNLDGLSDESDPLERLTDRERQVFKLIAEGNTNNGIAVELGISIKTVEKHRANLMGKLGVNDMAGLVREAIKHGLIFLEG
jgi:DNA-binding NarL/FixJ family response regulator